MNALVEFLLARIAEDEEIARAARFNNGRWHRTGEWARETSVAREFGPDVVPQQVGTLAWDNNAHIARHDPAHVLADCEAKRRIVESYQRAQAAVETEQRRVDAGGYSDERGTVGEWETSTLRPVLQLLALPYADHPDYDLGWKP